MDMNHRFARASGGLMTTKYRVIYSAAPTTDDPDLQTVFDPPSGLISGVWNGIWNDQQSLPNPDDRMKYVAQIAADFHNLMLTQRTYMERELREIQKRGDEKHA